VTLFMINTVIIKNIIGYTDSNYFAMRLNSNVLGNSKPKNSSQDLTISILLVLKSFIKNRLIDKFWQHQDIL